MPESPSPRETKRPVELSPSSPTTHSFGELSAAPANWLSSSGPRSLGQEIFGVFGYLSFVAACGVLLSALYFWAIGVPLSMHSVLSSAPLFGVYPAILTGLSRLNEGTFDGGGGVFLISLALWTATSKTLDLGEGLVILLSLTLLFIGLCFCLIWAQSLRGQKTRRTLSAA